MCRLLAAWIYPLLIVSVIASVSMSALADEVVDQDWICLTENAKTEAWQDAAGEWTVAGDAALDPSDSRTLVAKPGSGVLISTLTGKAELRNLVSKSRFADMEVHVEFLLPQNGNAGVKLQGLYEIQLSDSHKKKNPTASDCGGIYPRAELKPRYHTIDEGVAPRTNAAKAPGQWQSLDIRFQAPRFDLDGKKTANARFIRVVLNGQVIHEDVELKWPTGHAWSKEKEVARGPLFLQGDHGPVAYRNVRVRTLADAPRPNGSGSHH